MLKKIYLHWKNKKDAENFGDLFKVQNSKWSTIPFHTSERMESERIINFDDNKILSLYEEQNKHDNQDDERGWYRKKYKETLKGKKVLDLGSGAGKDGIFFALNGANVTFADLIESNLELIKKVCKLYKLNCEFKHIKKFDDYSEFVGMDYIFAQGSLHHNPINITKKIINIMSKNFIKNETRFLILSYPKERWVFEGSKPFSKWGLVTDGPSTPWAQYFEKEQIYYLFGKDIKLLSEIKWNKTYNTNNFIFFDILIK